MKRGTGINKGMAPVMRCLVRALNKAHQEDVRGRIEYWQDQQKRAVQAVRELWRKRIIGLYVSLEMAKTCKQGGKQGDDVFEALRKVEEYVSEMNR